MIACSVAKVRLEEHLLLVHRGRPPHAGARQRLHRQHRLAGLAPRLAEQRALRIAKSGVLSLTQTLGAEWASRGVRVNAISPGFVMTDLNRDKMSAARKALALSRTPAGRFGEVEEMVGAAVYLASPGAGYVTGQSIPVDGGFLAAGL
jgi:NAD(P)-dependent dehydrogenase (short-subunit alcohol dehydrogenase family)